MRQSERGVFVCLLFSISRFVPNNILTRFSFQGRLIMQIKATVSTSWGHSVWRRKSCSWREKQDVPQILFSYRDTQNCKTTSSQQANINISKYKSDPYGYQQPLKLETCFSTPGSPSRAKLTLWVITTPDLKSKSSIFATLQHNRTAQNCRSVKT